MDRWMILWSENSQISEGDCRIFHEKMKDFLDLKTVKVPPTYSNASKIIFADLYNRV